MQRVQKSFSIFEKKIHIRFFFFYVKRELKRQTSFFFLRHKRIHTADKEKKKIKTKTSKMKINSLKQLFSINRKTKIQERNEAERVFQLDEDEKNSK